MPAVFFSHFLQPKYWQGREKNSVYDSPDTYKDTGWCTGREKYRRKRHHQHWWHYAKGFYSIFFALARQVTQKKRKKKYNQPSSSLPLLPPFSHYFYIKQTPFSSTQSIEVLFVSITMDALCNLSSLLFFFLSQFIVFAFLYPFHSIFICLYIRDFFCFQANNCIWKRCRKKAKIQYKQKIWASENRRCWNS